MSRKPATLALLALLALLPPGSGYGAGREPSAVKDAAIHETHVSADKPGEGAVTKRLDTLPGIVKARALLISLRQSRLPEGNVEFCSGPGHQ